MKTIKTILLAWGIAIAILFGFFIGYSYPQKCPTKPIKEKVDTLVIYDTIMSYKPIYVEKVKLDSILVPVTDTMRLHDTLFVYLEREQVVWQDSFARVYASGILPQIDSVTHFQQTKVITIPVKEKTRWGLGVNAGYGFGSNGLTPYVGVGISYNILSW